MEKQWYEVKPGFTHGLNEMYGPGDKVLLSPEEARGFLDKLRPCDPPADQLRTVGLGDGGQGADNVTQWGALAPKLAEILVALGLTPEQVQAKSDEELLAIDGIGPAALKAIREAFPG